MVAVGERVVVVGGNGNPFNGTRATVMQNLNPSMSTVQFDEPVLDGEGHPQRWYPFINRFLVPEREYVYGLLCGEA